MASTVAGPSVGAWHTLRSRYGAQFTLLCRTLGLNHPRGGHTAASYGGGLGLLPHRPYRIGWVYAHDRRFPVGVIGGGAPAPTWVISGHGWRARRGGGWAWATDSWCPSGGRGCASGRAVRPGVTAGWGEAPVSCRDTHCYSPGLMRCRGPRADLLGPGYRVVPHSARRVHVAAVSRFGLRLSSVAPLLVRRLSPPSPPSFCPIRTFSWRATWSRAPPPPSLSQTLAEFGIRNGGSWQQWQLGRG